MSAPEKTAIVLLPGMDGTGELLRPLASRLSAHRRVEVIDYPLDRRLGYDELVAYVRGRMAGDRFVVVGESFSGPVAIELAATHPQVAGLVLAASFARHPLPSWFAVLAAWTDLRLIPSWLIAGTLMGAAATAELKLQLRQTLARVPREIIRARAQDALRVDKRDRLREITHPVLCLNGRSDRLVHKRYVDEIVALQPACEVRWLDAPHMLLATHVEDSAAVIAGFCQRVDLAGR